jgi:hypothetical protein
MEAILLGIYSFFVWLIFIKLKWLPWNTGTQVTVVIIPIVGMAALILLLNVFAPSSSDVRVPPTCASTSTRCPSSRRCAGA